MAFLMVRNLESGLEYARLEPEMIEKARPTSADAHFTVGASLGMLPFTLPPAEARRRSRPHDEVVFAAPAAPGTMSGALDEALAAIHTATSLLSELRCDGEVSGGHEGGADADAAPAAPPRGADELRGLLEQLSGVSVQVLLSAKSPGSTVLVAKDADDSSDDDGEELVMTELDPAEAAATLGLAAPAVDDGGDDGLSSDDEPLQSAPVTLGSADIAKLKAVNAGRAAPRRAPAAIACEYVAYADEILDFLRGGHAAFAHLFDKSLRRAHGARRATVKARRAALDGAAPPAGESAPAAAAARPAYSPLHRPEVPDAVARLDATDAARFRAARQNRAPAALAGALGSGDEGRVRLAACALEPFLELLGPRRVVGLRLPGGGGAAPPRADGPPRSVADALRVDDVAAPATAPVTAASFAAWLASPRKVAAAAVFGLNGSVAGALLEAPLAQLGRDLGLEARPNFAGELEATWASPDHAEPWACGPADATLLALHGALDAVLVPPKALADAERAPGAPAAAAPAGPWPERARGAALRARVRPGDALFVPAGWALELAAAPGQDLAHVLWVAKTWLTTNRDVAHCVPPEALSGGADDPVA